MSNVPDIRFKGFTDAWEQREFNELLKKDDGVRRGPFGSALKKEIFVKENEYVVYEQQNAIYDKYDTRYNITKEKYEELNKFKVEPGDFIMSGAGTIGRVSFVPKGIKSGVFNQALIRFRINNRIMDPLYFLQFLRNERTQKLLTSTNPGSAMTNLLPLTELKKWKVTVPIVEEQKLIGEFLRNYDNTITLLQRELDLENKTIEMFMDNLFIQKEQNIPCFNLSENTSVWKSVKLKEIGDTFTGLSGKNKDDFGHGDAWYITYMNVFSNPISNFNDKEKIEIDFKQNEVKYGDIFFTTSSETPNEVGMSSVWLGDDANIYLNSFCFGFRPKVELDPYFIAYLLRSKKVRLKISKLAQGISRYNISKTKMMEIEINIPDIKTQNEVGRILKELHKKKQITEKQIEKAKIIKKAFLQKLFPKGD